MTPDGSTSPRGPVTIYQVARRAGVSAATVSNALNRPELVRDEKLQAVLAAVDELGFVPKAQAVLNARKGLRRVAAIAPYARYPSYFQRLRGIVAAATQARMDVCLLDASPTPGGRSGTLSSVPIRGGFDGLLVMGDPPTEADARRLLRHRVPVVLLDAVHPDFSCVSIDDAVGARLGADHLHARGVRRVTLVSREPDGAAAPSSGERRLSAFTARMRELGVPDVVVDWVITQDSVSGGVDAAGRVLQGGDTDAAVCLHDDLAAGVLRGLQLAGCPVPERLRVLGYDDGPIAEATGLSTIRQPFAASGATAFELLRQRIAEPDGPRQITALIPELVVRSST